MIEQLDGHGHSVCVGDTVHIFPIPHEILMNDIFCDLVTVLRYIREPKYHYTMLVKVIPSES